MIKKISCLFLLVLLGSVTFPQELWNSYSKTTQLIPTGNYVPLPVEEKIVNPNSTTRVIHTPQANLFILPNFRPHPTTLGTQSEVILVRNPVNPNIMFGSSNAVNPPGGFSFISEGCYVTTNGGTSWFGSDSITSSPLTGHGGDPGPVIDKNGTFLISHLGYPVSGMFANYSTNNGSTWSASYTIASGSQDKNFCGTDDAPSSPYYGRTYTVWSWFSVAQPYVAISYTTNGGVSWSAPAQINTPPASHYSQGVDIRIGPGGEVYVVWAAPTTSYPYTEDYAGFAKSTNGGVTWTVNENVYNMNGIRGTLTAKNNIRVNGFPRIDVDRSGGPRNGWIYVVAPEINLSPAGTDPDIVLHRSTDGGTTWSAGIRVNQDAVNNGKIQYMPAVRVDETGTVNVLFYDDRNVASTDAQVWLARSSNGGNNWTEFEVSDHNFTPAPIAGLAGGYQGDYIGITSGNNKVWCFWMDNSSGIYQAWTTYVNIAPDLWSQDTPADTGVEPNPDTGPMWISNDIWVRNQQDGFTHLHQHQNPEYRDSVLYPYNPDYVYVMVRNRGGTVGSGQLKVYWAKASSGLAWPTNWINYHYMGVLFGDMIHSSQPLISNLAAGDSIVFEIPWFPPNPHDYAPFGADSSHICLLARIETSPVSPYGMTFPEGASVFTNVKNNNNIVWKNVTVVDNFPGPYGPPGPHAWVTVRNVRRVPALTRLRFITPKDNLDNPFFNFGRIKVTLTDKLFALWQQGGMKGAGIELDPEQKNAIWVEKVDAFIDNINLDVEQTETIQFEFILDKQPPEGKDQFDLWLNQCTIDGEKEETVGGEDFALNTAVKPEKQRPAVIKEYRTSAYPNPFNPVTILSYSLPKASMVNIKIYDILGREVATLVDEFKGEGKYEVRFDAANLASGIYFYRITAGEFKETKKLLLVR